MIEVLAIGGIMFVLISITADRIVRVRSTRRTIERLQEDIVILKEEINRLCKKYT